MRTSNLVKALVFLAGFVLLATFGRTFAVRLPEFALWVKTLGLWGPVALFGGYTVAALSLSPAFLLTLMAGAIWGVTFGTIYVMIGATLGALCAFTAARFVVRRFVERYVENHPRLAAIDRAVESEGLRLVFLLRLSPAVPYVLLNYVLGVSRVRFRDYLLGSVGMLPTIILYTYVGRVAGDLATVASGRATPHGTAWYISLTAGLVATIVATVLVSRAAKRAVDASAATRA